MTTTAHSFGQLFSNDALMPAQYAGMTRREGLPAPERKLRIAMLEDALDHLSRFATHAERDLPEERETHWRKDYIEARDWLVSDDYWTFSFLGVCEALGFSADAIRSRVLPTTHKLAAWTEPMRARVPVPKPAPAPTTAERCWAWALEQEQFNGVGLASAMRIPLEDAKGHICAWVRAETIELVVRFRGRTQCGEYRVRERKGSGA